MVAKQQILMPAQMPLPSEVPTPGHTDGTEGASGTGMPKKNAPEGKSTAGEWHCIRNPGTAGAPSRPARASPSATLCSPGGRGPR